MSSGTQNWIKKESKESWHTAKPLTNVWKAEDSQEAWHKHRPMSKGWVKEEEREHNLKSLGIKGGNK